MSEQDERSTFRSPGELAALLAARRHWFVRAACAAALIAVAVVLVRPRTWTATASFVVQGRRLPSGIGGVAAQLGLVGMGGEPTQSPAYFAHLVTSRGVVEDALGRLSAPPGPVVDLTTVLDVDDDAPEPLRRELMLKELRDAILASVDQRTGVISVSVRLASSEAPVAVLRELLDAVQDFNQTLRRSSARSEREFVEQRLRDVGDSLRAAEAAQTAFLARNRRFQDAPALRLAFDRLQREALALQSLQTSLRQAFEQARVEEVRDTPAITIVEAPFVPVRPDARGGLVILLGAVFGALFLALTAALLVPTSRESGRGHLAALARDLRRPWRLASPPAASADP